MRVVFDMLVFFAKKFKIGKDNYSAPELLATDLNLSGAIRT